MRAFRQFTFALIVVAVATTAWAQAVISLTDISRLETTAGDIDRQIAALERTNPTLAGEGKKTLGDLRDDITYLRVKLRRDGVVSPTEYGDVRDRLDGLSRKMRGDQRVGAQTGAADTTGRSFTVPVGTEMDVRLQTP